MNPVNIKVEFHIRDYKCRYKVIEKEMDREDLFVFLMHVQGYIGFSYRESKGCYYLEMGEDIYNKTLESIENQ